MRVVDIFNNSMNGLIVKRYFVSILPFCQRAAIFVPLIMLLAIATDATASNWVPLAKDGIHDPRGPAITVLQEPSEGLATLPPDKAGNMVNWMQAITRGAISPRGVENKANNNIPPMQKDEFLLDTKGSQAMVLFPHKAHTLWLECSNCHPAPFEPKIGASGIKMEKILNGEQCGLCHGSVAFPPTNCSRCHSVPYQGSNAGRLPAGSTVRP